MYTNREKNILEIHSAIFSKAPAGPSAEHEQHLPIQGWDFQGPAAENAACRQVTTESFPSSSQPLREVFPSFSLFLIHFLKDDFTGYRLLDWWGFISQNLSIKTIFFAQYLNI